MKLVSAIYPSHYPFDKTNIFDEFITAISPKELDENSALVVWGGGDISPSLYNKPVSRRTCADDKPSDRDMIEWRLMNRALELNVPIIGICRGAQMLCALAGGHLIQDVTGHGRSHFVNTSDNMSFVVSSLHHQMLYPFNVEHEMVAWSAPPLSKHYLDVEDDVPMPIEPEFVYFPKQKGIAIQWHPEYMDQFDSANQYVFQKVREYAFQD